MKPYSLVIMGALWGCSTAVVPEPQRLAYTGPPRPNVVVYLIDTLRADHLGAYGYPRETSPHIDAFARAGTLFERALAPDTCTVGSTPSLLTGQYTVTHGVDGFGKKVAANVPMLQTLLDASGYETGSFITNVNAGPAVGLERGFRTFHDAIKDFRDRDAPRTVPLAAIETRLDGVEGRPFFLYVHTAEPHRPYGPPSPWRERFLGSYTGKVTGVYRGANGYEHAETPSDIEHVRYLYDGEVAFADSGFGSLLASIERRGLTESTLIVLTADHGEELYDHGGWNHGHTVHDELTHIPLVVRGPAVPVGQRVKTPVSLIDVAPTVLESLNLPPSSSFEGVSLWSPVADRAIFTRSSFLPQKLAIRKEGWTLIQNEHGVAALYHQGQDPTEQTDRAAEFPDRAAALQAELQAWGVGQRSQPAKDLTVEERERLRVLGYIE